MHDGEMVHPASATNWLRQDIPRVLPLSLQAQAETGGSISEPVMKSRPPTHPALPRRITLVEQTVETLRAGIRSGHWAEALPGERKLCAELQIGRHTLRAALAELQRHGWLKNATGRQRTIHPKRTRTTTSPRPRQVIMLAPSAPSLMTMRGLVELALVRDLLIKAGYEVETCINGPCFSTKPDRALVELTRQHPDANWFVLGSKAPMQQWMVRHGKPCFISGSCDPTLGLPSIDQDYHATGHHAACTLLRKGHRHLALVRPRDAFGGDLESERGFLEAIHQAGPNIRHSLFAHDRTKPHLCSLLDTALRTPSPPTAFFVIHASSAITVMTHLMKRGKRIPQDIAILSATEDPSLTAFVPAVSHYDLPFDKASLQISRAVRQWIEHPHLPPKTIRLMPELVKGETV